MKKLIILCMCILVVGCKKNHHLDCSIVTAENGNKVINQIIVDYNKENVQTIKMHTETQLSEDYIEHIDTFEEKLKENFEDYNNKEGIVMNIIKQDKSVILDIDITVNKVDDEIKKVLGITSTYSNYKATKNNLQIDGYVCK